MRPDPRNYGYDLDQAVSAVVGLRATVPSDALTAESLGTERTGNGVIIRGDGLVLTIGYLITEAETVWITLVDGRVVEGDVVAYDQETGLGLVQALARLSLPALPLGSSAAVQVGERVVVAGAGGLDHSVAARIVAKREFAGYWEYLLDEAIFTTPAHPYWGGTAVIGHAGDLVAIGSLQLEQARIGATEGDHVNMSVPIDLLKPIMDDLLMLGRPSRPPRPWLGLMAAEIDDKVVVVGLSERGPAAEVNLRNGDVVVAVAGAEVDSLADLFRGIWALGPAGVDVPLRINRDGRTFDLRVPSVDRTGLFKQPRLH
jgi:S1-C subfamily serine protease